MGSDMVADYDCGHFGHISCHPDDDEEFDCAECVPTAKSLQNRPALQERDTPRDYIAQPLAKTRLGELRVGMDKAVAALSGNRRHVEDVDNPFYWLSQQTSLEWILRHKNGAGLQYMLSKGVQIDDFLRHGYTLDNLLIYKDFGKNAERAKAALRALGVTADHLVEHRNALPILMLSDPEGAFRLTTRDITRMGVGFHPTQGLRSPKTDAWQVGDMIYLGFTFDDLKRCGMKTRDLWDDLGPPTEDEMQSLGATWEDVQALPVAEPPEDAIDNKEKEEEGNYLGPEDEYEPPYHDIDEEHDRTPGRHNRSPGHRNRGSASRELPEEMLELAAQATRRTRKRPVGFRKPRVK